MGGMNKREHDFWYPKIDKKQSTIDGDSGRYCNYCGAIPETLWKHNLDPIMLIDHIDNNRWNRTIENFQFLCRGCNRRKNPHMSPEKRQMSQSEFTNKRVEKKWAEWVYEKVNSGETISWNYVVEEGAFKFDISTDTIEKRYYRKYFKAPSGPFDLTQNPNNLDESIVILKKLDKVADAPATNLSDTPTISSSENDN